MGAAKAVEARTKRLRNLIAVGWARQQRSNQIVEKMGNPPEEYELNRFLCHLVVLRARGLSSADTWGSLSSSIHLARMV